MTIFLNNALDCLQASIEELSAADNELEGDMNRCLDAGMDDYVSKPIQLDELRNKLIK